MAWDIIVSWNINMKQLWWIKTIGAWTLVDSNHTLWFYTGFLTDLIFEVICFLIYIISPRRNLSWNYCGEPLAAKKFYVFQHFQRCQGWGGRSLAGGRLWGKKEQMLRLLTVWVLEQMCHWRWWPTLYSGTHIYSARLMAVYVCIWPVYILYTLYFITLSKVTHRFMAV